MLAQRCRVLWFQPPGLERRRGCCRERTERAWYRPKGSGSPCPPGWPQRCKMSRKRPRTGYSSFVGVFRTGFGSRKRGAPWAEEPRERGRLSSAQVTRHIPTLRPQCKSNEHNRQHVQVTYARTTTHLGQRCRSEQPLVSAVARLPKRAWRSRI